MQSLSSFSPPIAHGSLLAIEDFTQHFQCDLHIKHRCEMHVKHRLAGLNGCSVLTRGDQWHLHFLSAF